MVLVDAGEHTEVKRILNARWLAGNLDSNDIADAKVKEHLNNGDNNLELMTNKFDWSSTDAAWEAAISSSDYWAAAEILDGIPGEKDAADNKRETAKEVWAKINETAEKQNKPTITKSQGFNNR
jgi:hypothetical protein